MMLCVIGVVVVDLSLLCFIMIVIVKWGVLKGVKVMNSV